MTKSPAIPASPKIATLEAALPELRAALLSWYRANRRNLPWRQNRDPYRVWLSEVMLQQTRVAAVLEHYRLFLQAFPTIRALARATEARVLALWSGLGYYRRARMLHQAAQIVVRELNGAIPTTSAELRKLPGVGRYTAAAIASIAFGEPAAAVDGNVERVLSRLDGHAVSQAAVWPRAQLLLDSAHPGEWNQAMMELGATVCTPRAPQCLVCPLHPWCRARGAEAAKTRPARKRREMTRAIVTRGVLRSPRIFLVQRAATASKMAAMWELPEVGDALGEELARLCHSITDTDYRVRIVRLKPAELSSALRAAGRWIGIEELTQWPITGLTRKALRLLHL